MKNNKSLGQHWLKDREILQDIADFALYPDTNVAVEIGPGLGTLTSTLLKNFEKVISIEFDQRLAENLPKSFPGKNLEVINQDVLSVDLASLDLPENYVVAGNIPYYNLDTLGANRFKRTYTAFFRAYLNRKVSFENYTLKSMIDNTYKF